MYILYVYIYNNRYLSEDIQQIRLSHSEDSTYTYFLTLSFLELDIRCNSV